ncbi:MAG: hypothetical protein KGM44_04755 [bacterium]|nr:hypothetical protein [bacterium]
MVYRSNLDIPAARPLHGRERHRVLKRAKTSGVTVAEIAQRAGIRYRVRGGPQARVLLWSEPGHGRTVDDEGNVVYAVARNALPQRDPERAARILEVLAYGCFDYAARESVCGRGIFVYPLTAEHGRAWLAEIGRRGGQARSVAKVTASRINGTKRGGPALER